MENMNRLDIVNGVIKKKLEERVLDTFSNPEELPEDFEEMEAIAKEYNFKDALIGIELIDSEIGKIQRHRAFLNRKKDKRKQEEAKFREYLFSNPAALSKIEEGLVPIYQEKVIRAGRLDIEAKDKEEKSTRVELKFNSYSAKRTSLQLMGYLNENEEARVIFVAPEINPQMAFQLKGYQDIGRLKFVKFERTNGDYDFKEIKPDQIEEPKQINWKFRERTKEGDKVRVTLRAPKERQKKSPEEIEWDSFPLYYQALMLNRPSLKNKKRYLKPIEISQEQMSELEALVDPEEHREAARKVEKNIKYSLTSDEFEILQKKFKLTIDNPKHSKLFDKGFVETFNLHKQTRDIEVKVLSNFGIADRPREFYEEILPKIIPAIKFFKDGINIHKNNINAKKYRTMLEKLIKNKNVTGDYEAAKKWERGEYFSSSLFRNILFTENLELKIRRTQEIMKIDENLALTYFDNTVGSDLLLKNLKERKNIAEKIYFRVTTQELLNYTKTDTELYKSIIMNLKVIKTLEETTPHVKEIVTLPLPIVSIEPKIQPIQTPYAQFRKTIAGDHSFDLSEDSRARIDYFLEDCLDKKADIEQLGVIFSRFNFGKYFRNREAKPSDLKVRNFLDDIYLNFIRKEKIPSVEELKKIYENN